MHRYAVISDSACDLPAHLAKQLDINIVPFKVSFDKTAKLAEGVDLSNDEFYRRLEASNAMPKTYYPPVGDYVNQFKKHLEQGMDVLCLCLSAKLSKSYASASHAQAILSHTYPNRKIMVIDTLLASAGQGMLAVDAVKLRESVDVTEACQKLETIKKDSITIVTVASLEQLARGGRMSNMTAALGGLLQINPIIYLTDGMLVSRNKAFGRRKALELVKKLTLQEMNGQSARYDFAMLHSKAFNEANTVALDLQAACGITQTFPPVELGATIGMHTGVSVVSTVLLRKI